jgi:MFS family permease
LNSLPLSPSLPLSLPLSPSLPLSLSLSLSLPLSLPLPPFDVAYENDLKAVLGWSQSRIELIGTFANAGTWLGIVGGAVYDRYGPRITIFGGSILVLIGYTTMHLFTKGSLGSYDNYGIMALGTFIMGQGGAWLYTAGLNTTAYAFPAEIRGRVIGCLVAGFSLSLGVFTLPYAAFFQPDVTTFFLFNGLVIGSIGLILCTLVNVVFEPEAQAHGAGERDVAWSTVSRVNFACIVSVVLALYVGASGLMEQFVDSSNGFKKRLAFGMLSILALYTATLFRTGSLCWRRSKHAHSHDSEDPAAAQDRMARKALLDHGSDTNDGNTTPRQSTKLSSYSDDIEEQALVVPPTPQTMDLPDRKVNYSMLETLCTLDCWLITTVFGCVVASGVTVISNLGNFNESLGGSEASKTTLATLFAVFDTFGRLGFGILSDRYLGQVPRAMFLVLVSALMCVAMVFLAFTSLHAVYGGIIFHSIAYGGMFSLGPVLISERFGMLSFGKNSGVIGLTVSIASYCLSTLLAGNLYDRFAQTTTVSGATKCVGSICYRYTLLINAGICIISTLTAVWLARRQYTYRSRHQLVREDDQSA